MVGTTDCFSQSIIYRSSNKIHLIINEEIMKQTELQNETQININEARFKLSK